MSNYHDDNSRASDPGQLMLSTRRLRQLDPALGGLQGWFKRTFAGGDQFEAMLAEHIQLGDSRAACVISVAPLRVAAYTDELDCIAMLDFQLVQEHGLQPGQRLLTVNTYSRGPVLAADLIPGEKSLQRFANFYPVIAEFVSEDAQRIAARKASIGADEWQRCLRQGQAYAKQFPDRCRSGSPLRSADPAL